MHFDSPLRHTAPPFLSLPLSLQYPSILLLLKTLTCSHLDAQAPVHFVSHDSMSISSLTTTADDGFEPTRPRNFPVWVGCTNTGWDLVLVPAGLPGVKYKCKVRNKKQVLVGADYDMKVLVNPCVEAPHDGDLWETSDGTFMMIGTPLNVVEENMPELVPESQLEPTSQRT